MPAKCAVCSLPDARALYTLDGIFLGSAHDGACVGLLWEAHFVRATGGDEYEHSLVLWRWQRRRAEVAGRSFTTPPPTSPAEDTLERWALS